MPGIGRGIPYHVDKPPLNVEYWGMRWFSRESKPPSDWEIRVESLERKFKAIESDWDEWYDKYRRLYARLSKRIQDSKKADEDVQDEPNGPVRGVGNPLAERMLRGGRSGGLLHDR